MFMHTNMELVPHGTDSWLKGEIWHPYQFCFFSSSTQQIFLFYSASRFIDTRVTGVRYGLYMCLYAYCLITFLMFHDFFSCLCDYRTSVRTSQIMWSRFTPCWRRSSPWNYCPTLLTSLLTSGWSPQDETYFKFQHTVYSIIVRVTM